MEDSETPVRIPKGILKNKYGGNSRESGSAGDVPDQIGRHSSMNYGVVAASGWDPQLGLIGTPNMPVPVPAPQHGMNMPNPVLASIDPIARGIKSEFSSTNQKVHEFIKCKRDLLFRQLDPEETPLSEIKGTQQNTEDHYGIVPSFDHFLRTDSSDIKQFFFHNAQVGDIVIGRVLSRSSTGVYVKLLCTEGGKHVILEDLGVRTFCPSQQAIPATDPRDPNRHFETDDYVRLEVLEVKPDSERIVTGMKGVTLNAEMQHSLLLGLISRHDIPRYYTLSKYKLSSDSRSKLTFQEMLAKSPGFQNPNSVSHLASGMGIYHNSNSLMKGIRDGFLAKEKATQLRRIQNAKWAHGHVAEGIKYFKLGKYTEAFQRLNNALNIDAENVEGLVARGALYANNGSFEKAIDDFESALKFNPNHFNARKYLAETLVALGRQQESQGKLEDAIASYSKSLVVRADHKEAKEALWSLHARTEKLDPTKMTGAAAAKAAELKAKLKTILQSELGLKVESKSSKEKKSKKEKKKKESSASEDESSSSSSSDESSSESSSSGSGYKKKSKKRKKRKSKKSKKSRRESVGSERKRELSLSPFSKRLSEPHGVMPSSSTFTGFTDSTYAELQLGIAKHDKNGDESDAESKRSSKRSKDKKRSKKSKDKKKRKKHASSDSSSSDSESSRSKKKSKKPAPPENPQLQAILPDLGDLEAKLSAYYSKIEQGKIETKLPRRSPSKERSPEPRESRKRRRDLYDDIPPRVVENIPPPKLEEAEKKPEKPLSWSERKPGKIDLQTDEYGNIQHETIVRTVNNEIPEQKGKFEMKFKPLNSGAPEGENGSSGQPQLDLGSKWRPLGAAAPQSEAMKNAFEREASIGSEDEKEDDKDKGKDDRNYRGRSQSSSRSPSRRRRRSRSYSSHSRSKSRSRSYSRSRSRSRSPSYRRERDNRRSYRRDGGGGGGYRGRAPVRFFRGYNYGRGTRRPYNPRPAYRERERDFTNRSKFRNRFSRTPSRSSPVGSDYRSRSRSRSKSRSISPRDRRRESPSRRDRRSYPSEIQTEKSNNQIPDMSSKMEADSASQSYRQDRPSAVDTEIQIGSLKTTSAADVEYLLDKRNAEKKEEMRKSNPDFFRAT